MSPYREIAENVGRGLYLLGVKHDPAYRVGVLFAETVRAILKAKAEAEQNNPVDRPAPVEAMFPAVKIEEV